MHDQRSRDPGSKGHPSSRRVRRKDLENGRKKNVSKLKRLCIVWNTRHPKVPHDPSKSWHVLGGFTCHARHAMMSASNGNAQWATGAMPRRSNGTQGTRRRDPQPERNSTLARIVQRFDVYAKVDDDLQVKTETGAAVTIGFWLLMVVLVVGEVQAYLRVQPAIERVVVDSTMGQRVRINADITFHAVPCLDVHVDAMDVAGENQIDIDHDMTKQRLNPDGSPIAEPFTEIPGEFDESLQVPPDYCGSCYGAKGAPSANGLCCNTCKEVANAYTAMGWALHEIRRTAEQLWLYLTTRNRCILCSSFACAAYQCVRDYHLETPIVEGEGCRLAGFMTVNKVSGNFHVAAGEGVMRDGRHIHLYNMDDAEKFNSSHTINRLSFGEPYPGMRPNPLDGTSRIIDEDKGTGLFQYFIKLVPTVHSLGPEAEWGAQLTSQFAYTYKFRSLTGGTEYHTDHTGDVPHHHAAIAEEHDQPKAAAKPMLLPGIFFVYDVSPFMVEVAAAPVIPFSHLLIRLCAVAGGAFAVSGIVDSAVFHVSKRLRRHSLLGR